MLRRRLKSPMSLHFPAMAGGSGLTAYERKVLGYNPTAYWPLKEASGGVAYDISGNGFHGAYTGVMLGQPGIGDGNTCPLFDGINDYVTIYSDAFRDAFNEQLFTVSVWAKVLNAAVWTDGANRYLIDLERGATNLTKLYKRVPNDTVRCMYAGAGTSDQIEKNINEIGWMHWSWTVTFAGDEFIVYYGGLQEGAIQTGLGQWDPGNPIQFGFIGAERVGSNLFKGYESNVAVFNSVLNPVQIADLATV